MYTNQDWVGGNSFKHVGNTEQDLKTPFHQSVILIDHKATVVKKKSEACNKCWSYSKLERTIVFSCKNSVSAT